MTNSPKGNVSRIKLPIALSILLLLFCGAGVTTWVFTKEKFERQPEYRLTAEMISVPERPDWVEELFVTEVLTASGLQGASLLDTELPQRLAHAFTAHPWVETVEKIELRFPAGAVAKLNYRTPTALVQLSSQGLFPVDRNAVLLPTDYFIRIAPEKNSQYIRIAGIRSMPIGTVGTPWGDPLVLAGAKMAELLKNQPEWNIIEIKPYFENTPMGERIYGRFKTQAGTEILWGRWEDDENKNNVKISKLNELIELYRSIDLVPESFKPIDLTAE